MAARSDVGRATLVNAGLHDLTTPKMHSTYITICLVGSYPTFSPLLSLGREGGYFLLHWFTLTDDFQLRSRMLYVARTFLLHLKKRMHTASRPTDSYVTRRYKKINVYECRMLKKMYFCRLMKRLAYILRLC